MGIPEDLGKEEIIIRGIYLGMYDKYMSTNQKCARKSGYFTWGGGSRAWRYWNLTSLYTYKTKFYNYYIIRKRKLGSIFSTEIINPLIKNKKSIKSIR